MKVFQSEKYEIDHLMVALRKLVVAFFNQFNKFTSQRDNCL